MFLAGFGWEEVFPTSLHSAFHSTFHHFDLLTAGIWMPDANQAPCGQVAWTDFPFKHYLARVLQRRILSNSPQLVILTPLTNFLSSSFLLLGTLLPSPQHPGSFSVPAAAWVQTQLRRWWWQWETLRSKWGRAKKRRREAAWSSSLRKENGRVRWTADGWDGLFRSADRGEEETQGKWSHGLVLRLSLLSWCDLFLPLVVQEAGVPQRHQFVWA